MKMSKFFKNWKFYIIDAKIPKDKLEDCKNKIFSRDGQLIENLDNADVILTIFKTPTRLARYVSSELRKPICSIDWIEEWCASNTYLQKNMLKSKIIIIKIY
jgi:hypothetical protein